MPTWNLYLQLESDQYDTNPDHKGHDGSTPCRFALIEDDFDTFGEAESAFYIALRAINKMSNLRAEEGEGADFGA